MMCTNKFYGTGSMFGIFLIVFLFLSKSLLAQHFQTSWSGNAYQPMTIIITEALLDGLNCESGDEIAVFDINDLGEEACVGTSVLTDVITPTSPLIVTASKDDNLTSEFDGFIEGNEIIYKFWDNSTSLEVIIILSTYDTTPPFTNVYTSLGTALVELVGFSAINTSVVSDSGCSGDFIVPVIVSNAQNIKEFNLKLDYGNESISYFNYQDVHDSLAVGTLNVSGDTSSVIINWTSVNVISLPNDTLLKLVFQSNPVYTQIIELLTWDTISNISFYLNSNLDTLPCLFNNGEIIIDADVADAGAIVGDDLLCQGILNEPYNIDTIPNASSYIWELAPQISGTIVGSGSNINIDWSPSWSGIASLSVFGSNSCGDGVSSLLYITIQGNPLVYAGVDTAICFDNVIQLAPMVIDYASVIWLTNGDGSYDDLNQLNATYFPGPIDIETQQVILALQVLPIDPCSNLAYDSLTLSIDHPVGVPGIPVGPEIVNTAITPFSNYLIDEVENATYYNWIIFPEDVGDIIEYDNTAMVIWNTLYPDTTAKIIVEVGNMCDTVISDTLSVSVFFAVSLAEKSLNKGCIRLSPNPTSGIVKLRLCCTTNSHLWILNTLGEIVLFERIQCLKNKNKSIYLDLSNMKSGLYFLRIANDEFSQTKKIILQNY